MRTALSIVGIIILSAIFYGIVRIQMKNSVLQEHLADLKSQLATLEAEDIRLTEDVEYYSHPENLEKEARARLNLKTPGETLVIIPHGKQKIGAEMGTTTGKSEEGQTFWERIKKFFEAN